MSNSEDCSVFFTSVYPKLLGNARPTVALKDCCIDPYFRCDSGRITQIYLASTSLSGSIPSDIEKLPMLTYLNLDSNSLTDSIPSSIGKLSQLKFLSVSSNSLSGNLPSELSKLSNLQYLSVSSNKLNDELSATFWRLTNLEELDLFGNAFTGTLPPQIGQLTKLKKLFLKQNSFSGPIPAEIGKLTQLTVLDLQNNSFSGQIPVEIRQLQNFKQFKFDSVNSGQDGSSIVSGSQVLIIALIGVIALVLIIIAIWYFKYRGKSQKQRDSELSHLVTVDTNRGTDYTHENSPTIVALESARNSPKYVASPVITSSNNSISSSNKSLPSQSIHKISYETAMPQNLKYNGISRITQSSGSRESYRALRKYTDTSSGSVSDTVPKVTFIPKQQGATRNESVLYEASFSIKKKLTGKGGCGQVYMATFGKQNAVAKFPIHEKHEDLIHEESKLMGILKSKWTVEVLQFMSNMTIKISGQPYMPKNALLLEYMNLGCFSKYLRANPSFENLDYDINTYNSIINQTLSLIQMSAEGINFIHEKGYNHLDIKTENILLHRNTDGSIIAKISDFGSTRLNGGYDSVFLTPIYLAPEGRMAPGQANIPQVFQSYLIISGLTNMTFMPLDTACYTH
ncbi:hypothetical protein HDV02_005765 [Globomyces sp. JEL0801]|nr:hypothetical protein HDV02_005765 [Globomyces sp. JEL0801]